MMIPATDMSAAILAGGASRRMGSDKALKHFDGIPLLQRARDLLSGIFAHVVVAGNEAYSFLGIPGIPDHPGHAGPAAGIYAALNASPAERVFVLACDMPHVTRALVQHILDCTSEEDAVVASDGRTLQPLCGVYHRRAMPVIDTELRAGRRVLTTILDLLNTKVVTISPSLPCYRPDLFHNVNFPGDLAPSRVTRPENERR
jgi:molybdopterin-guanine dinucleotide biosynthesis protein A